MSEYKELIVLSTAQQGLESLAQSSIRSFCLARDFMLPRVSVISFVLASEPESVPYLGVYKASTGELVTYSNEILPCSGMYDGGYRISYKTRSVIETADEPGFIFAFYDDIPVDRYHSVPGTVDVAARNGALLEYTLDTVWAISDSVETTQMPYVELSAGVMYTDEDEIDCTYAYTPFDEVGEVIVSVLGNAKYYGSFINTDAGVITYKSNDSEDIHSSNTSAVAVRSSMTATSAADQLEVGKLQNLYIEDGWMPLLTFKMPDNWEWDICAIKPNDRNEYNLCGRISNGTLEWQFGNLVSAASTPATIEAYEKWVYNEETGQWEVVVIDPEAGGSGGGGSSPSPSAEPLKGFIETVARKNGSFNTPILGWAGEEESKKTMLKDGKLRASCEPVYLGMFNLSMSYLAGIVYDVVDDPDCDKTCDFSSNQSYYEAVQEVSPVWFLFASTKNDLLNLVAIEHKIYAGEMDGTWEVPEDVTDPYALYGPPPQLLDKYCEGKPPVSYENFRIWLYTNFILPPSRDMVHVPEDTDELQAGYYYVHNITGSYYRIPDDLIESGCKSTPSPRWMLAHSVIDNDDNAVEVPLCTVGEDNSVSVFNNTNKGYRGFIDNVLAHEYRWQRINNSWEYVPYTASSYVADINKTEGLAFQTQAYLPVGSRYSKTYASYTNYVFRLVSVGRCLKFETVNASDSVGDSIVGDGVYVISVPGGIEYTSSVFKRVEEAPVEVKSIAVTTGTTLAYDTPPEYNITDISVFEGDIGDGNVAITNKATVTDDDPGNIVLYNEYNSPYYGISWVAPGFVLGGRNAYRRAEDGIWSYASMSESDPKASTYTGTLVLQGRNIPEIDLTSFSNVILDQAILYPIDHTVFGNVTVPNDTLGGISFPESLRFVLPVRMSSSTSPIYVDRSISVTNASGNEEVFGEVINSSTVYAFYQYVTAGSNTFNNIAFGQGDGASVNTEAGLLPDTAGETTGLKAYFKLTSRPRLKNQYAGIVYDIPRNVRKFRLSFEVSYPETTVYPIKYSVWLPYNSDPDVLSSTPIQAECLVDVTQLSEEYLYVDTEIEVPEDSAINYNTKVLVLFVTDSNTASAGKSVLVKDVLLQAICNTNDGVDELVPITGSLRGYTHIKNLHIDEDGKFACYSGVDGSTVDIEVLEGSGVLGIGAVPEGYFKNAAGTNTLRIRNAENFDGMYYLGDDFSQYSRADDISDKITPSEYSSIAVQGSNVYLMDGFRSNMELTSPSYAGYTGDVLRVDRLILCNNSTLSASQSSGYAVGANECIVGQGVNIAAPFLTLGHGGVGENPIGISSYGAFSFSSRFEALGANIRGTATRLSAEPIVCTFTVNLSSGLDQFERVAPGIKVYTAPIREGSNVDFIEDVSGDTITVTEGDAYYYAIKGNAVQESGAWLDRVVLKSEYIATEVLPGGAPVLFYRTTDGSVVFKTPVGYDPLTSTSSDSVPLSDSDIFILEGNMDFAADDRFMDLTTWVDVDKLSRYYIKDVDDPNNTCYEVERTTLTCCDPTPVDCCDEPIIYGGSCNKNCGTPPQPCPDGATNIPGCGDDNGGGNGNNKEDDEDDEDDDDPGGGGGGGGGGHIGGKPSDWDPPEPAGKHMYTAQGQVYLYTVDGALKGTYTNVDAKVVGTRGGSASSNRVTFSVPAHKLKLSFEDVANNVVGNGARIAEVAGEMTFPVTFTMDSGPQDYSYPKGKACVPGTMYYGMTSLSSAGANHLRLGIIYNSSDNGGQRGDTTYTKNVKMPIEDIGVVVKISDTLEVGPTQAPKSIERKLTAMGLKWEQASSKPKKIYNGADYCVIRINSIVISPVANFRGRVIGNSIPSADLKCRGKTRGSIELGSTGMPSMGPTITAKSSTSGNVRIWRKDGAGPGKLLSLKTKLIVTNYKMAGDTLTTVSGDLQNSEWNYCTPGQALPENATEYPHSRASGKIFGHNYIIVEGELMNG